VGHDLLERQRELRTLTSLVERAVSGHGSTALVLGDAGIGKTSLVRELLATLPRDVRVLAAACEDLLTPRTLGPLRDAVRGRDGPLADALKSGADQDAVFAAVLAELGSGTPTLVVVDDVHWADGATLDVLRFLGRRIADLPAMLLLTYRDDQVDDGHPLRNLLGGMTGAETVRLRLAPLTVDGVTALAADAEVDTADLFRLTQGNPFFVTEVLATAPDVLVPPTVVDAVHPRLRTSERIIGVVRACTAKNPALARKAHATRKMRGSSWRRAAVTITTPMPAAMSAVVRTSPKCAW